MSSKIQFAFEKPTIERPRIASNLRKLELNQLRNDGLAYQ